jgi:hypothetical protein
MKNFINFDKLHKNKLIKNDTLEEDKIKKANSLKNLNMSKNNINNNCDFICDRENKNSGQIANKNYNLEVKNKANLVRNLNFDNKISQLNLNSLDAIKKKSIENVNIRIGNNISQIIPQYH